MKNKILEISRELHDEITALRREIHVNPELGFKEKFTTIKIKESLECAGLEVLPLDMESGVLAILKGTKKKEGAPVTALRADIDALSIQECTNLDYSSANAGVMHACGHDGNLAVMVGVAHVLSRLKNEFSGVVKFIFQPAEETLLGACKMIDSGVLENPKVDYIFACHSWPYLPVGKIGIYSGSYMASADAFYIEVSAPGTHGGYPHCSPDPVSAATQMVQAINCIVSREIDTTDPAVISVCQINGGTSFNIIPNLVTLSGTIRCHSSENRQRLHSALKRVVAGVSSTCDCGYEIDILPLVPPVRNSAKAIDFVEQAAKSTLGEKWVAELTTPSMGSEDFSLYLEKVPHGAFIRVGNTVPGELSIPLHNNKFDYNDRSLPHAMAVMAQTVLDVQNSQ